MLQKPKKRYAALLCLTAAVLFTIAGIVILLIQFDVLSRLGARLDKNRVRIPILMYHNFADEGVPGTTISAGSFESQIKALHEAGYTAISFDELYDFVYNEALLPEHPLIITIDDGYMSVYDTAYPILKKYDMKATAFIIGISFGKDVYRDNRTPIFPHFGDTEAVEMVKSGVISIQSHSYDMHQFGPYETGPYRVGVLPLDDESEAEYIEAFRTDFELASNQIESVSEKRPFVYSYPYGKYNELSENLLKEKGIKVTVTIVEGVSTVFRNSPDSLLRLKRYNVPGDMSVTTLLKKVAR